MPMTLNPVHGIRVIGMANAWPEDLLGPGARKRDEDIYAALLGGDWENQLIVRGWDVDRARNEYGVNSRSWTRGTNIGSVELAIAAGEGALRNAGMRATDIDCIIVATCTPTHITSTVAAKVARHLRTDAAAIDIRAGGAGGLTALTTAAQYHAAGCKTSLVIAAEVSSRYLGDHDLANALLFGDGAAALLLTSDSTAEDAGLLGAVSGNCDWSGTAFTVPGELPPSGRIQDYVFQRPDTRYREQLAAAWNTAGNALRTALPDEGTDAVLPYAVTRQQITDCAAPFSADADDSITLLATHGCIGCASPLAAMVERWQRHDNVGDTVASLAVAGGISWTGLMWRR